MTILKSFAVSFFATPMLLSGANSAQTPVLGAKNIAPTTQKNEVAKADCVPCKGEAREDLNKNTASDNKLIYK